MKNYIELWTVAEHVVYSSQITSTYRWDITTLELPIVYPIDDKWKIKYVKQGVVVYEGVISRFTRNTCPYGNFLVIDKHTV